MSSTEIIQWGMYHSGILILVILFITPALYLWVKRKIKRDGYISWLGGSPVPCFYGVGNTLAAFLQDAIDRNEQMIVNGETQIAYKASERLRVRDSYKGCYSFLTVYSVDDDDPKGYILSLQISEETGEVILRSYVTRNDPRKYSKYVDFIQCGGLDNVHRMVIGYPDINAEILQELNQETKEKQSLIAILRNASLKAKAKKRREQPQDVQEAHLQPPLHEVHEVNGRRMPTQGAAAE